MPEGTPEPVGGWAALGLVFAWGEEDDGTWTPIHKVGPEPGNLALWERAYAEYRRRQCSVLVPLGLSDTEWLRAVGRMGLTAAVTPPTPTQLEAVKQALKHGHTPVGMKRPEGGWAAIGLAQASRRVAGKGVEHYYMPGKTPEQRARWEAAVRAYRTSSAC